MAAGRRNVLLIVVDQWRADFVPHLGAGFLRTPNLDRLCREGVVFCNHVTTAVPCGPARASLLTGLYLMNHRAVQNTVPLDARHVNLGKALRLIGYDPALIGYSLAISAGAQGYAAAVRQLGASPWRVYGRHVLPNIASTLIVSMTLAFPEIILLESGLSFLGLGVQPPQTSLGNMVGYGREYLTRAPWMLLAPSAVIILTTLSVSVLGDWLRDRLDPALR